MDIHRMLDNLLALPGVQAASVFELEGTRRLGRVSGDVSDGLLDTVGAQAATLLQMLDHGFEETGEVVLRFEQGWVLLRRGEALGLMVMVGDEASVNSTRVFAATLMRHANMLNLRPADGLAEAAEADVPADRTDRSVTEDTGHIGADSAPPEAEPPRRKVRMYRGQAY